MSGMVLHVFPTDLRRGAQVRGRMLCDLLDGPGQRHRVLTIFTRPVDTAGVLRPDRQLDVPPEVTRRLHLDPLAVLRLRRTVKEEEPDVVVAHGGESLKYAALACPRHVPLVYDKIGIAPARMTKRSLRMRLNRLAARRAQIIVCVSEDVRREASERWGYPRDRMVVIPNGRDPSVFSARVDPGTDRPSRLLFVGRLVESKRPELFLALVERLRADGLALEAGIVGDGPLVEGIRARAGAAGVELLGERTDVPELLRDADVFVFTGRPHGEGMPGVVIEAALSGLPVVATDAPGVRSIVEDGVSGFLVDSDDIEALVAATSRLVRDRALRTSMGAAARAASVAEHGTDAVVAAWSDVLTRAADGRAGRGGSGATGRAAP